MPMHVHWLRYLLVTDDDDDNILVSCLLLLQSLNLGTILSVNIPHLLFQMCTLETRLLFSEPVCDVLFLMTYVPVIHRCDVLQYFY